MNEITVNGEKRTVAKGTSLSELLSKMDLSDRRIAVELNKGVVRKKVWHQTRLSNHDVVEVIHFVGGG